MFWRRGREKNVKKKEPATEEKEKKRVTFVYFRGEGRTSNLRLPASDKRNGSLALWPKRRGGFTLDVIWKWGGALLVSVPA